MTSDLNSVRVGHPTHDAPVAFPRVPGHVDRLACDHCRQLIPRGPPEGLSSFLLWCVYTESGNAGEECGKVQACEIISGQEIDFDQRLTSGITLFSLGYNRIGTGWKPFDLHRIF